MPRPYPFLLPLTAALLGGCGPASQERDAAGATQQPKAWYQPAAPDSITYAVAPDSQPDTVASVADSVADSGRPERLVLLPVGADIGPQPLECDTVGWSKLPREKNGLPSGDFYWDGRLLSTRLFDGYVGALLLRRSPRDTAWLHLPISVPEGVYEEELPRYLAVQLVNLDQQGPPEVLFSFSFSDYGSGSGSSTSILNVFALDGTRPRLLLRATESTELSSISGDWRATTERTVRLRGRDIELGAPESSASGEARVDPQPLPGPPPGRYRYQHGRLYRVETGR